MTTNLRATALVAAAGLAALAAGGCGGPPRAQVRGTVTLDGKPVPTGVIQFVPTADQPTAGAAIKDGVYQVEAAVGPARVTINASEVVGKRKQDEQLPGSPEIDVTRERLPARYTDREKTELAATLTPGRNEVNFDLKGDPKK